MVCAHIDSLAFGYKFRMESLFRLLLHEQNLVQEDHNDAKLVNSIEYHWRDLATTLETAKWQVIVNFSVKFFLPSDVSLGKILKDFERE